MSDFGLICAVALERMVYLDSKRVKRALKAHLPGRPVEVLDRLHGSDTIGQAVRTEGWTVVDLVDPNLTAIVAELRLVRASAASATAEAGTLRVPGRGAYALICEGP